MKLIVLTVLVVGVFALTTAEDKDLSLLKRLLQALEERETRTLEKKVTVEKRTSYGIMWSGKDRTISVYLQQKVNCNGRCTYDIEFYGKGGDKNDRLYKIYPDLEFKEKYMFTEADLTDSVIASNGLRRLPPTILVEVCMTDREGRKACNMRSVDTTLDEDKVFHKTEPGYFGKENEVRNTGNKNQIS